MGDTFHWLDIERIAEELADEYTETDPLSVRFPELRAMVEALDGFVEQPLHPVNERILEAIQMAWVRDRDDLPGDEEE